MNYDPTLTKDSSMAQITLKTLEEKLPFHRLKGAQVKVYKCRPIDRRAAEDERDLAQTALASAYPPRFGLLLKCATLFGYPIKTLTGVEWRVGSRLLGRLFLEYPSKCRVSDSVTGYLLPPAAQKAPDLFLNALEEIPMETSNYFEVANHRLDALATRVYREIRPSNPHPSGVDPPLDPVLNRF